jgi:DNA-binding PadR family transcriptional regulator
LDYQGSFIYSRLDRYDYSLYPYLNRLEKKGYITSRWEEENDRKGVRRKYYQISIQGIKVLGDATLVREQLRRGLSSTAS